MNKLYNDTAVQAISNAIRAKNGSSDTYTIAEMSTALNDLSYYAKPTISNVALATFEADGLPLNSLKVAINAVQSGSGVPSPENVRPISGWSEVVVSDVGKNLANVQKTNTVPSINTGENVPFIGWTTDYIKVDTNVSYTLSVQQNVARSILFYANDKTYIGYIGAFPLDGVVLNTYSRWSEVGYIRLRFDAETTAQLEVGTSATAYEPYNPDSYTITISLGQTVYGGELDVVNGILKITDGYIASYNGETLPSTWISSMDVYAEGTTPTIGAEVCYERANPISTNLTPTLIKSLNGQNNLSVDCGEVIELEYFKEV